jgi:hypothetical protein
MQVLRLRAARFAQDDNAKRKSPPRRAFGAFSTLSSGYLVLRDFLSGLVAGKCCGIWGKTKVILDRKNGRRER